MVNENVILYVEIQSITVDSLTDTCFCHLLFLLLKLDHRASGIFVTRLLKSRS